MPYMRTGRVQRRIKIVFSVAYSNRGNSVRRSSCWVNGLMTGAKDKSNRGRGDNGRGAAAVVFGSGPAIKEADRVEGIDTAGARCASVKVWVGLREE